MQASARHRKLLIRLGDRKRGTIQVQEERETFIEGAKTKSNKSKHGSAIQATCKARGEERSNEGLKCAVGGGREGGHIFMHRICRPRFTLPCRAAVPQMDYGMATPPEKVEAANCWRSQVLQEAFDEIRELL